MKRGIKNEIEYRLGLYFSLKSGAMYVRDKKYGDEEQVMKQLEDELFREKLQRDRLREEQKYHQDRQRDDYKYHQDMNTMKRKDASEFLKWLPGVVTSVIGIITLILQIKAKVP